ncbi:Heterogeneous nuclear ribonucleoprotein 1 [Apostasia shenzhenica]|uniref:Heterogeneous nuclear ribonucleoprotein 1 n=1 Tax=Apostasia shenzhenica TaxID=1088818 RepID=A0A2H9ZW74_9ASPA|nr:Heterogeneous nuclear ribonucleoprotein 1 [Apostasia shenzhenica]
MAKNAEHDGASPGKIFIGGLPKDTSMAVFLKHFGKYGEIIDSVIMKDRYTQQPRGFGFITYADPAVVDKVIEDTHVFNGKQVEIKRTIPKGSAQPKDFKTKKIFVGGIPSTVTQEEFKSFFSKYGKVVEHEIICDHATKRSRGFGFIIFDSEKVVDDLLAEGNMIDLAGSQVMVVQCVISILLCISIIKRKPCALVEIKKAEPKKSSNQPPPRYDSEYRGRHYSDGVGGGFNSSFGGVGGGGFGPSSYRGAGGMGPRLGAFGSYGGGAEEFGSGYGGYGGSLGGYRGESSFGYSSRLGSYGGGFGGGYSGGGFGAYGRDEGFGGYGGSGYGGGYDSGPGAGYGSGGGLYGGRGSYGTGGGAGPSGRYHPYSR